MNARLIALVGAVIFVIGHFLPVLNSVDVSSGSPTPISVNFLFNDGQLADGIVTAGLTLVAIVLALLNMTKHALWPALLALGWLAWRFFDIKGQADQVSERIAMLPPEQLNGATVGVNYLGWGIMFLGIAVLIAGAAMAWKKPAA